MSLILDKDLPYIRDLQNFGINVYYKEQWNDNDTLYLAILNLMPNKLETEVQILKALGFTNKNIYVDFIYTKSYKPTHTSTEYLKKFYTTFNENTFCKYHGLIVTGAPVEKMDFSNVMYWSELETIMNYAHNNFKSTLYICWSAQAALYHFYKINKYPLNNKAFGVFSHKILCDTPLKKNIRKNFYAPHSRHTYIKTEDLLMVPELEILDNSSEVGPFSIASKDYKNVMFLGHIEYDLETLKNEYFRDLSKGIPINVPNNYFQNDDPNMDILNLWNTSSHILFSNWINILSA